MECLPRDQGEVKCVQKTFIPAARYRCSFLSEKLAGFVRRGGGWKRDHGSRIEGHCESRGLPTEAYRRRASP